MSTFRIKNITNELGIRDEYYNKTLNIEYLDNFSRKIYKLRPKQTMYLKTDKLDLTIEKLRLSGYIVVDLVKSIEPTNIIRVDIEEKKEKPQKREPKKPPQKKGKTKTNVEVKEENPTTT